ncbi:MAG: LacI family DNA-binding transcriptional regulator [Thermomonas sp.]|uniref:LacI family DNA-binding transcriptional regulator n=1 Tax=Thermomonas sp. TaxID=1971895 RepID=UPI001EBF1FB5|nr:LacI family DNA-binding transcriptional regulator [Thermomonas sp.]MBV2208570.1 LacI family DNA-binding transcriptional regulator [Thermomonas sp.]
MHKPTIKDVAARAEVSLKTVSRVINDEPGVHAHTRDKVRHAIALLGYQPDPSARSLRSAQSYALGLLYDNPNPYYVIALQQGVLSVCRESGYGLQIHPCDASSPQLVSEIVTLVRNARLAGIVLAPPMSEDQLLVDALLANGVRLVRIVSASSDPQAGGACVYVDDRDAAYAITEHLIQLGHQRIGFLWGGKSHGSSWERYKGYTDALNDYGITLDPELIGEGDYAFDDGFRGARRLLQLKDRPTAIFGSNDEIAAGVLAAARSGGLNVPYDLSIAGFEDSPFSKQSWPALTTAKQATEEIARHATRRLLSLIREQPEGPQANQGFSPELVVRASTAPPRPKS